MICKKLVFNSFCCICAYNIKDKFSEIFLSFVLRYRLYTMDRRSQLRQKYPEMSFAEQVRKMGAEWSHEVNSNVKQVRTSWSTLSLWLVPILEIDRQWCKL